MSQIPYGTGDGFNNFLAVVLTIGSPTLGAYSLVLAVISNRWLVKRLQRSTYTNRDLAAQILGNLQQVSLRLPDQSSVRPGGSCRSWQDLAEDLDYSVPKWTLASVMAIMYIALADIFSWVTTLGGSITSIQVNATGESISSLWLCFLPIVIGYLQLSPKSDLDRIDRALVRANGYNPLPIDIQIASRDRIDEDEVCSAPVFFYARVFTWVHVAWKVACAFDGVPQHAPDGIPTPPGPPQTEVGTGGPSGEILSIVVRSALFAIALQWGTTGAAVMAIWYTPTEGLGCRSASYLLYGILSTVIWLLCVVSSVLTHCYSKSQPRTRWTCVIYGSAIILRHAAKTLATLNAVWLFLCSLLQFSNLENNCYCNSCVISLHSRAYVVVEYTATFARRIKVIWAWGLLMSALTAGLFGLAITLLRKLPNQHHTHRCDEQRNARYRGCGQFVASPAGPSGS